MNIRKYIPLGLAVGVVLVGGSLLVREGVPRAAAQASGGTVTGQVLWCAPLPYGYAVPGFEDGGTSGTVAPGTSVKPPVSEPGPDGLISPYLYPYHQRMIPAGAVLVAVQGTALSARTDEEGNFAIANVPAGTYLTVAAGPVAKMNGAFALRPNVLVPSAGASVDVGGLTLSQPCSYYGPVPYAAPPTEPVTPDASE